MYLFPAGIAGVSTLPELDSAGAVSFRAGGIDPYGRSFVTPITSFGVDRAYSFGDLNGDGSTDIADLLDLALYYFDSSSHEIDMSMGDIDGSGRIDIARPYLFRRLQFRGWTAPGRPTLSGLL